MSKLTFQLTGDTPNDMGDDPRLEDEVADGIKILKQIRLINKIIPIYIFTSHSDHNLRLEYYKDKADGFISKNDPDLLSSALGRIKKELELNELIKKTYNSIEWSSKIKDSELQIFLSLS